VTTNFLPFPPSARTLLVFRYGIVAAFFAVLAAAPAIAIGLATNALAGLAFWLVFTIAIAIFAWWWSGMVYHCRTWRKTEGTVELRNGVIWKRHTMLPRNRVQNVTINSGPIRRRFGLVTVVVHSAGATTPNITLEGFPAANGEALQAELLARGAPETSPIGPTTATSEAP
jgi:membrane protein YdbS with pleckstrin-like domain